MNIEQWPIDRLKPYARNARKITQKAIDKVAVSLERICYGLDIDPKYVDVIVQRWQKLTGKEATLEGDGRTFEEVGRERGVLIETDVLPKKATAKAAKPARKKAKRTTKR